jgi:hypothetical protein
MRFARWVFLVCGVYGILALAPLYFMERSLGVDYPPAITHPEFFYATIGVALAWQVGFLVMSRDPLRFRPLMPIAILEKIGYGVPAVILYLLGRSPLLTLGTGIVDLGMALLFWAAFVKTGTPAMLITPGAEKPSEPQTVSSTG